MDNLKEVIAKNLILYRTSAKLTQGELAEKINYSDKSISKWERGLALPDVLVLKQLADLYQIKLDDFFNETENIDSIKIEGKKSLFSRHLLISLLSVGLVWFVATIVFVCLLWAQVSKAWLSFIFAIPVSAIVAIVFSKIWANKLVTCLMVSLFIWTSALTVFLCNTSAYLLFIICVPAQVLVVLWYLLLYIIKNKNKITESIKRITASIKKSK